jgi:NAD(P)-dependent dehydrogenase (short-subunit alcohol dehydrogenase family)
VALVTGASSGGTGTAIAVRLAAEGASVAIAARNAEGLAETRQQIEALGATCCVLPVDLSEPTGGRRELVARAEAALGPIDILVNDAFVSRFRLFDEATPEELEQHLQVNFVAPWELMKAAVPGMRERGRGWVLNLTTLLAELPPGPPFPMTASRSFQYGATKAALNRLTVSAAAECEGDGIAVNALSPISVIATRKFVDAGSTSAYEPLETMAEAALALCTGDPATLTGRIAFSLQLLLELGRPVHDLHGDTLLDGWQPQDLAAVIARQQAAIAESGWPGAYAFGRVNSPTP